MLEFSKSDLDEAVARAEDSLRSLEGARILVTGGTGFLGRWICATLAHANDRLGLDVEAWVVTRSPQAAFETYPGLWDRHGLHLWQGDVRTFADPDGAFSHVVHGAAETSQWTDVRASLEGADAIVSGTRRVLEFAETKGCSRLLFLSSGAVYGTQPVSIRAMGEDYALAPLTRDRKTGYAHAKRLAEWMCVAQAGGSAMESVIARCYAFLGPGLPLNGTFAAGNFIRDSVGGDPIVIKGTGRDVRTYLYAGDLAVWVWTMLVRGNSGEAYNVGSDEEVTIGELANVVAKRSQPPVPVQVLGADAPGVSSRYVPSITKARELGLEVYTPLNRAVDQTWRWCRAQGVSAAYR